MDRDASKTTDGVSAEADEAETPNESLVEMVLAEHAEQGAAAATHIEGVVIGRLEALGPNGEPLVDFIGNRAGQPIAARATVATGPETIGREVALMFECGDPARPILIGLIHAPTRPESAPAPMPLQGLEVQADGERVTLSATKEIVIRCGKASITLTSAGKILIRGAYLLSRSSGVNRVQGGSVQIN